MVHLISWRHFSILITICDYFGPHTHLATIICLSPLSCPSSTRRRTSVICSQTSLEDLLSLVHFLVEHLCLLCGVYASPLCHSSLMITIIRSVLLTLVNCYSLLMRIQNAFTARSGGMINFEVPRVVWLHLVRLFATLVSFGVHCVRSHLILFFFSFVYLSNLILISTSFSTYQNLLLLLVLLTTTSAISATHNLISWQWVWVWVVV